MYAVILKDSLLEKMMQRLNIRVAYSEASGQILPWRTSELVHVVRVYMNLDFWAHWVSRGRGAPPMSSFLEAELDLKTISVNYDLLLVRY